MSIHVSPTKIAVAAVFAAAFGLSVPASAESMAYKAELNAATEVPPTVSKGMGMIQATYDSSTMMLSWSGTYGDLTGPEVMAHFHGPAAVGANAGVMVPADATASPFMGSAKLTAEQAKALEDGKVYFNIHTAANKPGEIRGWLVPAK